MFLACIVNIICLISTCQFQNAVCDIVFTCSVGFNDCFNQILRNICVVCKELFGVFRQTVTAISERWIIVVKSDTWIKADAIDNLLCIQTFHLCIGIQFVKVRYSQCQICISKKFYRFCFCKSHDQSIDVLFNCTFLQKCCKGIRRIYQSCILYICTNNDT